jgi:Fungal Zn(2)-Cys(6) binuclear cluster domain
LTVVTSELLQLISSPSQMGVDSINASIPTGRSLNERSNDSAPGVNNISDQAESENDSKEASPDPDDGPSDGKPNPKLPMQKRRRVTRACDECRRKKIKCDGKQPCTHCTVYSYGAYVIDPHIQKLIRYRMHIRPAVKPTEEPRTSIYRGT